MCYTTCNEAALQVLTEGKLITWGQRQFIYRKNYQHFNPYIYGISISFTTPISRRLHNRTVRLVINPNPIYLFCLYYAASVVSWTDYLLVNLKSPPDINGRIECISSDKLFYLPPSTKLEAK